MSLSSQLRHETRDVHDRIEQLPVSLAIVKGTITRENYCELLVQQLHLHKAFEDALAAANPAGLFTDAMRRTDVIVNDLVALDWPVIGPPTEATQNAMNEVQEWAENDPFKLLGALYVLEGSRMGSMVIIRPIAQALGVSPQPGNGVDYHLTDRSFPGHFAVFKRRLDGLGETDHGPAIIEGANRFFQLTYNVYEAVPEPVMTAAC